METPKPTKTNINHENGQNLSNPAPATSAPAPNTPDSASSYDTYQRASECLRKLQQDIAIFRDPKVRSHLQTLPLPFTSSSSSSPTPTASTTTSPISNEEQQATIIALRTTVRTMEESVRELEAADLRTRKRAARAEGQLSELRTQRDAQERAHQAAVVEAAQRIRSLEQDAQTVTRNAEAERLRLVRSVDTARADADKALAAKTRAQERLDVVENRVKTLENQINTAAEAHRAEINALKKALLDSKDRERETCAMLANARNRNRVIDDDSDDDDGDDDNDDNNHDNNPDDDSDNEKISASNRKRREKKALQEENIKLKSEVQWLSERNQQVQKSLTEAEKSREQMRSAAAYAREQAADANKLRERVQTLENVSKEVDEMKQLINALQNEKQEMRSMIVSLSSNRQDVAEGVSALKTLGERDRNGMKTLFQQWMAEIHEEENENENIIKDDVCMSERDSDEEEMKKLNVELEQSREKIATLESQLMALKLEIDEHGLSSGAEACEKAREKPAIKEGEPDFDAKIYKVIHLEDNPLSRAIRDAAEKERIVAQEKRARGKKRVRSLSGGDGGSVDVANNSTSTEAVPISTPLVVKQEGSDDAVVTVAVAKEEIEQMQVEIEETKKENEKLKHSAVLGDRMRQVALKRIDQVRSAVETLFGWSMKMNVKPGGTNYAVSSIYVDSPNEVLHFFVKDSGVVSLMDCDYAHQLSRELEQYVEKMDSFPALLAHITLANLEKSAAFIS